MHVKSGERWSSEVLNTFRVLKELSLKIFSFEKGKKIYIRIPFFIESVQSFN